MQKESLSFRILQQKSLKTEKQTKYMKEKKKKKKTQRIAKHYEATYK